eukprot:ANDGO_03407.mRNA.1 hypothetical protein
MKSSGGASRHGMTGHSPVGVSQKYKLSAVISPKSSHAKPKAVTRLTFSTLKSHDGSKRDESEEDHLSNSNSIVYKVPGSPASSTSSASFASSNFDPSDAGKTKKYAADEPDAATIERHRELMQGMDLFLNRKQGELPDRNFITHVAARMAKENKFRYRPTTALPSLLAVPSRKRAEEGVVSPSASASASASASVSDPRVQGTVLRSTSAMEMGDSKIPREWERWESTPIVPLERPASSAAYLVRYDHPSASRITATDLDDLPAMNDDGSHSYPASNAGRPASRQFSRTIDDMQLADDGIDVADAYPGGDFTDHEQSQPQSQLLSSSSFLSPQHQQQQQMNSAEARAGETNRFEKWRRKVFPSLIPATREQVKALEEFFLTSLERHEEEARALPTLDPSLRPSDQEIASQMLAKELYLVDVTMSELVRQVSTDCRDRGSLLTSLYELLVKRIEDCPSLIQNLETQVHSLSDEVKRLDSENEEKTKKVAELEMTSSDAIRKSETTKRETEMVRRDLRHSEAMITRLNEEVKNLRSEVDRAARWREFHESVESELMAQCKYYQRVAVGLRGRYEDLLRKGKATESSRSKAKQTEGHSDDDNDGDDDRGSSASDVSIDDGEVIRHSSKQDYGISVSPPNLLISVSNSEDGGGSSDPTSPMIVRPVPTSPVVQQQQQQQQQQFVDDGFESPDSGIPDGVLSANKKKRRRRDREFTNSIPVSKYSTLTKGDLSRFADEIGSENDDRLPAGAVSAVERKQSIRVVKGSRSPSLVTVTNGPMQQGGMDNIGASTSDSVSADQAVVFGRDDEEMADNGSEGPDSSLVDEKFAQHHKMLRELQRTSQEQVRQIELSRQPTSILKDGEQIEKKKRKKQEEDQEKLAAGELVEASPTAPNKVSFGSAHVQMQEAADEQEYEPDHENDDHDADDVEGRGSDSSDAVEELRPPVAKKSPLRKKSKKQSGKATDADVWEKASKIRKDRYGSKDSISDDGWKEILGISQSNVQEKFEKKKKERAKRRADEESIAKSSAAFLAIPAERRRTESSASSGSDGAWEDVMDSIAEGTSSLSRGTVEMLDKNCQTDLKDDVVPVSKDELAHDSGVSDSSHVDTDEEEDLISDLMSYSKTFIKDGGLSDMEAAIGKKQEEQTKSKNKKRSKRKFSKIEIEAILLRFLEKFVPFLQSRAEREFRTGTSFALTTKPAPKPPMMIEVAINTDYVAERKRKYDDSDHIGNSTTEGGLVAVNPYGATGGLDSQGMAARFQQSLFLRKYVFPYESADAIRHIHMTAISMRPQKSWGWLSSTVEKILQLATSAMQHHSELHVVQHLGVIAIQHFSSQYGLHALFEQSIVDFYRAVAAYALRDGYIELVRRFLDDEYNVDQLSFFLSLRSAVLPLLFLPSAMETDGFTPSSEKGRSAGSVQQSQAVVISKSYLTMERVSALVHRFFGHRSSQDRAQFLQQIDSATEYLGYGESYKKMDAARFLHLSVLEWRRDQLRYTLHMTHVFRMMDTRRVSALSSVDAVRATSSVFPLVPQDLIQRWFAEVPDERDEDENEEGLGEKEDAVDLPRFMSVLLPRLHFCLSQRPTSDSASIQTATVVHRPGCDPIKVYANNMYTNPTAFGDPDNAVGAEEDGANSQQYFFEDALNDAMSSLVQRHYLSFHPMLKNIISRLAQGNGSQLDKDTLLKACGVLTHNVEDLIDNRRGNRALDAYRQLLSMVLGAMLVIERPEKRDAVFADRELLLYEELVLGRDQSYCDRGDVYGC